jgi:tetratricopeptide (TPR) repeat protein
MMAIGRLRDPAPLDPSVWYDGYSAIEDIAVSEAKFWRGVRLRGLGRLTEAESLLEEVVRRQPDHYEALHQLGVIALQTRRVPLSIELFDRTIALKPDHANAYNNRGTALRALRRLDEALLSYDRAVEAKPDFVEAFCNRGGALTDLGRPDEALASYDRAIALNPEVVAAHNNRGNILRDLRRPDEALASYDRAIALDPNYAAAHNNRGSVLEDLGRPAEALSAFDTAIALQPDFAEAHHNRGNALRNLAHHEQALASYDRAIALRPSLWAAHDSRGSALLDLGRPGEALASFDTAIMLQPHNAELHNGRGCALRDLSRHAEALESFDAATGLQPDFAAAVSNRGNVLADLGRIDQALACFDRAIELTADYPQARGTALRDNGPEEASASDRLVTARRLDHAAAYHNRGTALATIGRFTEALANFETAIALRPDFVEAYNSKGLALRDLGHPEGALSSFEKAIALKPDFAAAFCNRGDALVDLRRHEEALTNFQQAITLQPDHATLYDRRRYALRKLAPEIKALFSLGKFRARRNEHEAAFAQWRAAHALLGRHEPFSREDHLTFVAASIAVLDRARLTEGARARNTDPAPVFVVGMPRSGTTLIEQILAAHAHVHGASERRALADTFARLGGLYQSATAVQAIARLDADQFDTAAAAYLSELHALAPDKARIVDKMPGNYQYLGLVGLMLPGARIIHCERDPRDIGLSIYAQLFQGAHNYAHDLADLGWTIAQQQRLMAHWKAALPNPILTVRLDDWIGDFDGTLARVLDHLELPPDPNCARFYESDRWVPTASRDQVRQPINAKGIGRWRPYAKELAPMIAELEAAGALRGWAA